MLAGVFEIVGGIIFVFVLVFAVLVFLGDL